MQERPRQEAVVVARRCLQQQHATPAAGRPHQHAAAVVLLDDLARRDRDLDRVHGRAVLRRGDAELDANGDARLDGRDGLDLAQRAVLQHAHVERPPLRPVADHRRADPDERVDRTPFACRDPADLAVGGHRPRPGADGIDGHTHVPGRRDWIAGAGVRPIGDDHDARQALAAVALPEVAQRTAKIGPGRAGLGLGRFVRRAQPLPKRKNVGLKPSLQRRQQPVADQRPGLRQPCRSAVVRQTHAARGVHQDRDNSPGLVGIRLGEHRLHQENRQQDQAGGPERHQRQAARLSELLADARVRLPRDPQERDDEGHGNPPGDRVGKAYGWHVTASVARRLSPRSTSPRGLGIPREGNRHRRR